MRQEEQATRNAILKATFELLSTEDVKDITIRRIAYYANVAVSAINYHFQTKENLIDLSVKTGVAQIVKNAFEQYKNLTGEPVERLKTVVISTCNIIASMARISKLSILNDLQRGFGTDNIYDSVNVLALILKDIFDGQDYPKKSKDDLRLIAYQITASVHFGFFRSLQMKNEIGLDFFNSKDREKYIEKILINLIHK